MNKYQIVVRHKINNEVISNNLTFNNLSKMDYDDLDIIVAILYEALCNEIHIDLQGLDIFYRHECGHDELLLSVSNLFTLESIHKGLDIAFWTNKNIDKEIFNKDRKDYLEQVEKRLKYYELDEDFKVCFKNNKGDEKT